MSSSALSMTVLPPAGPTGGRSAEEIYQQDSAVQPHPSALTRSRWTPNGAQTAPRLKRRCRDRCSPAASSSGTARRSWETMPTTPHLTIVGAGLASARGGRGPARRGLRRPSGHARRGGREALRPPATVQEVPTRRGRPGLALPPRRVLLRSYSIELYTSARVRSIDPPGRRLQLASGEPSATSGCCWPQAPPRAACAAPEPSSTASTTSATGATPTVSSPPWGAPHALSWSGPAGSAVRSPPRYAELGRDVTLVGLEAVPLARVLGPEIGCFYRDLHAEQGSGSRSGRTSTPSGDGPSKPSSPATGGRSPAIWC